MELIYFISGVITVGAVYSVYLLRAVKSSHTDLLERYQSQSNISSIRNVDIDETISDLEVLMKDIQSDMKNNQYVSISEINKELKNLKDITSSNARKQNESGKTFTSNINKAFNEIQTLKNNFKALGQDPNFLNRY